MALIVLGISIFLNTIYLLISETIANKLTTNPLSWYERGHHILTYHNRGSRDNNWILWFFTWVYFLIDDVWQQISPLFKRLDPAPMCSDRDLTTRALVCECLGGKVAYRNRIAGELERISIPLSIYSLAKQIQLVTPQFSAIACIYCTLCNNKTIGVGFVNKITAFGRIQF